MEKNQQYFSKKLFGVNISGRSTLIGAKSVSPEISTSTSSMIAETNIGKSFSSRISGYLVLSILSGV
jgi:hypothetical protein